MNPLTRFALLIMALFCYSSVFAQHERCAWHHITHTYEEHTGHKYQPPSTLLHSESIESSSSGIITIPVIFHIIHSGQSIGTGPNLAEHIILAQLDQINDDFRRANSDRHLTPPEFLGVAADLEIEFCLAKRNPNGFPTSGIQRYNFGVSQYTPSQFKHIVQSRTTWNRDEYLNIWVADLNGYLGYAYLPGGESVGDGLTLDYITVGSLATPNPASSPFKYGRTATHEIGHWLGLDHHWATPNDCFRDDGVGDTPKQYSYYVGSPSHPQTSCGSTDMFMNFLDYVDDKNMNLYTEGQKSVMRTVLNGLRSTLQFSTACSPVDPLIMFNESSMMYMEGSSNCSLQGKTVKVDMVIAKAPSRTATVNLSSVGTAQMGRDFNLSSSRITFPAGSTSPRSFDIIIHKDAQVEDLEDIQLNFSVQSNGGNARKGMNNQELTLMLLNDDPNASPSNLMDVPVGQHMGSGSLSSPFQGGSNDARFQAIYLASELSNAGIEPGYIESISFYVTEKRSSRYYEDFSVKIGLTEQEEYGKYPHFANGLSTVYEKDLFSVAGKMEIKLDYPVYWDGSSNVIIETCYNNSSSSSNDKVRFHNTGITNRALVETHQSFPGCALDFMPTAHSARPIVYFKVNSGESVATKVNSFTGYAECEFGPYDEIKVLDQDNGEIMMVIKNTSNHDYGCTKIEIDQGGTGARSLWGSYDKTPKSFYISPEFNSPNGTYEITLYYSRDEIASWERNNRLGDSRYDLKLLKSSDPIQFALPGTSKSHSLQLQAFGNDYSFTASLDDGFSGFSLSNWPGGGFLALQNVEISAEWISDHLDQKLARLDANVLGIPETQDSLYWYRSVDQADPELVLVQSANKTSYEWIDSNLPPHQLVSYFAAYHNGSNVLKSNTVVLENDDQWEMKVIGNALEVYSGNQGGQYSIVSMDGRVLDHWRGEPGLIQRFELKNLSSQVLFLVRLTSIGREVRKVPVFR